MTTWAEFQAACGTTNKDTGDYAFDCFYLPYLESNRPDSKPWLPQPWVQQEARAEIMHQLTSYLYFALKNKDDPWRPIKIMIRAERLISIYVDAGFDLMEELQEELQHTLHAAFRLARRHFIKRALLCPPHEIELYQHSLREFGWNDAESHDDLHAVEAHLAHGRSLLADLRDSKTNGDGV